MEEAVRRPHRSTEVISRRELRAAELLDGRNPWTGPRAISKFVNLSADEPVVGGGGPTRWVFTDLDATHREILRAADIDGGRFQQGWGRLC